MLIFQLKNPCIWIKQTWIICHVTKKVWMRPYLKSFEDKSLLPGLVPDFLNGACNE